MNDSPFCVRCRRLRPLVPNTWVWPGKTFMFCRPCTRTLEYKRRQVRIEEMQIALAEFLLRLWRRIQKGLA